MIVDQPVTDPAPKPSAATPAADPPAQPPVQPPAPPPSDVVSKADYDLLNAQMAKVQKQLDTRSAELAQATQQIAQQASQSALTQAKLSHLVTAYAPAGMDVAAEMHWVQGITIDEQGAPTGEPMYRPSAPPATPPAEADPNAPEGAPPAQQVLEGAVVPPTQPAQTPQQPVGAVASGQPQRTVQETKPDWDKINDDLRAQAAGMNRG